MCKIYNNKAMDIYVIGDTQIKPGVKNPLVPVAWDIIESRPDKVVHLGDHHDMPSLSAYDRDKVSFHTRRYIQDINAGNQAFYEFWSIIQFGREIDPSWECEFILCLGNHENRINKAMENGPSEFQGLLELYQPDYTGWDRVSPFLKPVHINGVSFVHYLANEFSSRAISTASAGLNKKHNSFVCGHKQVLDYAEKQTLDGRRIMGLQIGACYFHDEEYKGHQNNNHFRGSAMLRNVKNGEWEMEIKNLLTLDKRYG